MRLNYDTCLSGEKTVLVPYRPEHVVRYHEWMKSPFLLEMTGSEPLSYDEEVEMQQTWRDDDDKCTFILLAKELCEPFLVQTKDKDENKSCAENSLPSEFITKSLDAMAGDVNLFLSEEDDDDDDVDNDDGSQNHCDDQDDKVPVRKQAELDLMVAEEDFRGKGIGRESACMMILYGAEELGIRKFIVKIKEDNVASRHLFENVSYI